MMNKKIVVVGGGAAGMMAAIFAAEQGAEVTLLEPNERLGKKLNITGKGRCNVTNNADIETLMANTPKNGKFRFIGTGDDVLAVRFNHETVLEAGYYAPTAYDKENPEACHLALPAHREAFLNARKGYEMIRSVTGCDKWNRELGGLVAGAEFSVKEGEEYPIEIAIADISGASVGYVLFIEDVTDGKDSQATQYDLFRTCDANPAPAEVLEAIREAGCAEQAEAIPFNADSWVWESVSYEIEGWE